MHEHLITAAAQATNYSSLKVFGYMLLAVGIIGLLSAVFGSSRG